MESEPELKKILHALQATDKEDIVTEERARRQQDRRSRVAADIAAMDTDDNQVDFLNKRFISYSLNEPPRDKTNKTACPPSEDSDQPGHLPRLIRVFAVRMKKPWGLSYPLGAQGRLISDWADAQADLSLRWAHVSLLVLSRGRPNVCDSG